MFLFFEKYSGIYKTLVYRFLESIVHDTLMPAIWYAFNVLNDLHKPVFCNFFKRKHAFRFVRYRIISFLVDIIHIMTNPQSIIHP